MTNAVRIFIGVDPGAKGACGVLACVDAPADDARHGEVVGFDVFDLPTVEREAIGGSDLDVHAFVESLAKSVAAVKSMTGDSAVRLTSAIVEFPDLGGQMKGGRRQAVVQGLNAGMAFAALMGRSAVHAEWVASRSWRQELGGLAKGDETEAALDVVRGSTSDMSLLQDCNGVGRTDRAVAVLLADVLRHRWLGTAVVPKTKGAGQAAKTRKSVERKAALALAVAPRRLDAVTRTRAMEETWCPVGHEDDVDVPPLAPCSAGRRCCEARLLDWAWRQRPEPSETSLSLGTGWVELLPRVAAIYKKAVTSKAWTVAWVDSDALGTMDAKDFDALESHGLVQLQAGVRFVRYQPTERGLAWARRLLVPAVAAVVAVDQHADVLAPTDVAR